MFRTAFGLGGGLAIFVVGCGTSYAQAVSSGDVFQIDAAGTRVHVQNCVSDPYPKCTYFFQQPDGSFGVEQEGWNEDLAEMRDAYNGGAGGGGCGDTVYSRPTSGSVGFSQGVAEDFIRNVFTSRATDTLDVSVSFASFRQGQPVYNSQGYDPATGASLVNFGAPPDALMYPISVSFSVCEETGYSSSQHYDYDWTMYCFIDEYYEWACGNY